MTAFFGILVAAALFALFGYTATRPGTRVEGSGGCHHGDACAMEGGCEGCGEKSGSTGWWPDRT